MDNFINKYAQGKNAQEMIRANAMAEAEEKERMAIRLSEYDTMMQEMRQCNLHTLENAEKVKELLAASLQKIEEVQKADENAEKASREAVEEIKGLLEEATGKMAEFQDKQKDYASEFLKAQKDLSEQQSTKLQEFLESQNDLLKQQNTQLQEFTEVQKKALEEQRKALEERLGAVEEFNHKEAVKVYRNVQAVIEESLPKQTEEIKEVVKSESEAAGTPVWLSVVCVMTFLAASANVAIEVLRLLGCL